MTFYLRRPRHFHNREVLARKEGEMLYVKQLASDMGLYVEAIRTTRNVLSSLYIRHPFWCEWLRVSDHLLPLNKLDRENFEWHKRFGTADIGINVYAERSASFYQRFLDKLCNGPDLRRFFKIKGRDFSNPKFRQFTVRFRPERYNFDLKVFRNGNCMVQDGDEVSRFPNFRTMLGSFAI